MPIIETSYSNDPMEWIESCPTCGDSVTWRIYRHKLFIDCDKCSQVKVPLYGVVDTGSD